MVKVHGDGEVEVLRAESSVGVMRQTGNHVCNVLCTAGHHSVMVMGVAMTEPLEVKGHAEVGQF